MSKNFYIAVDFDGTISEHKFPDIGREVPGAFKWLKKWQAAGVKLILWTMRSGPTLSQAVEFCRQNGVEFFAVNGNPTQSSWTDSPKAYANLYIDDTAYGCPLVESKEAGARLMADWSEIGPNVTTALNVMEGFKIELD